MNYIIQYIYLSTVFYYFETCFLFDLGLIPINPDPLKRKTHDILIHFSMRSNLRFLR